MFSMLSKLTKATVAVALSPVALVVEIVTLPASSCDYTRGPFDRTAKLLDSAGRNVVKAVKAED